MAARQPNESSPLLPGRSASRTNGAINGPDDSSSLRRLQRARYALIPLLLVAIVGILWVVSGPSSDDATTPWRLRKPLVDSARYSDAELLTLAPPFQVYGHPLPPKMINRSAFATAIPTNAFWSSLLVGDDHGLNVGAGPLTVSPYTLRSLPKRLEVSYGDVRRVATKESVTEYFHVDLALTAYAKEAPRNSRLLGDGNSTWRHVVGFDQNSVAVQYRFDNQSTDAELEPTQFMMARLVRGSPYVTVEYQQLKPVLEFNGTVYAINNVPVQELDEPTPGRQQFSGKRFEIDVGVYATNEARLAREKWIVYFANERTLQLQVAEEKDYRVYNLRGELTTPTSIRLVDSDFYTGAVRAAIVPVVDRAGAIAALDKHANVYPVATTVKTQVEGLTALISLSWTPKTMDGSPVDSLPLLLLAHPHHADSFSKSHQTDSRFKVLSPAFGHRTVKSYMTPVIGNTWVLEEQLPDVGFYGSQIELDQLKQKPDVVEAIATALRNDSNYTPEAQDPYYFGKEIGRQARLALIADTLGGSLNSTRDKILEDLQDWIAPWLVGKNPDMFVYDRDWGGLCSSNGLSGVFWMTDFGNGWYNDHHFHYGYFLYALAVVSKFRPDFAETHKAAMLTIARDIANFNSSDPYFPLTRHFSWYDGHSYASGVYLLDGGKSQESVSEAINAYYGVYLLGKALGVKELEQTGHVLVALESRAARTYWQMPSDSTVYEPVFAQNRMTGQVAATKVSYTTWFGPEIEHMHLINMIPFTPITETFLSPKYVTEEYPVLLKEAFQRPVNPIDDRWRGYAYLDLAIIDPQQAWDQVQKLDFFDDGSSRTNSLFWIATRSKA